jgi:hypothetical protein
LKSLYGMYSIIWVIAYWSTSISTINLIH